MAFARNRAEEGARITSGARSARFGFRLIVTIMVVAVLLTVIAAALMTVANGGGAA
jgi:hypothetical protein